MIDRFSLMGIKRQQGIIIQTVLESFGQGTFQFAIDGLAGRDMSQYGYLVAIAGLAW